MMMMNKHDPRDLHNAGSFCEQSTPLGKVLIWQIDDDVDKNRFCMTNYVDRDDD